MKIICPECERAGQKSVMQVEKSKYYGNRGAERFYDEEGRYHVHDKGYSISRLKCSSGHKIELTEPITCASCGWSFFGPILEKVEEKPDLWERMTSWIK